MGSEKKSSKWELKPDKFMSARELKQIRTYAENQSLADLAKGRKTWVKHWMLVDLSTRSGLRVSEIRELKISDLNLGKEPTVHVRNGKGGKARFVYIDKNLKKHLKEFIRHFELEQNDYVFQNKSGGQLTRQGLEKNFYGIVSKAGLRKYSIHCARHSYATEFYRKSKNLEFLRKQLGHSRIETTTVYIGISKEDAVETVNGIFDD